MREYTLQRDGKGPLIFEGEPIAESIGDRSKNGHAHDMRIYRVPDGRLVLELVYVCVYRKRGGTYDPSHFYAKVFDKPDDLAAELAAHRQRIDEIFVYPIEVQNGPKKRARMLAQIVGEYDAQVGELLDHEIFAEQL